MKKIVFFFSFLVLLGVSASDVSANINTLCAYCPDLRPQCSGQSGNQVGGEFFQCKPGPVNPQTGRGTFTICKNANCDNFSDPLQLSYEKFEYDAGGIYHVEEGLWAGGKGINRCSDGSIAYNRRFASNGSPGVKWLPASVNVGDTFQQVGRVQGYSSSTRAECSTSPDPAQPLNSTIQVSYAGCMQFPNGNWTANGIIFSIIAGAGAGENFYFDTTKGWIGFDRGDGNGNYASAQISPGAPPEGCKLVGASTGRRQLPPPLTTPLQCNASYSGDQGVSRPIPCSEGTCNQTRYKIPSCASSFGVGTTLSYLESDVDFFCDANAWVERTWTGIVTVDASETKIPYVGKTGQESREKYLADYLEGTCPFYNKGGSEDCVKDGKLTKNVGTWQMLAPKDIQDNYKKDMIDRAKKTLAGGLPEGGVHDYIVGSSFLGPVGEKKLSQMELPPTPPPLPKSFDAIEFGIYTAKLTKYLADYALWKINYEKLWAWVPQFTREDTAGKIIPYLGSKPLDKFSITTPDNQIEKVPHVARLFEVSKAVENLFLPASNKSIALNPNSSNLAFAGITPPTPAPLPTPTPAVQIRDSSPLRTLKDKLANKLTEIASYFESTEVNAQTDPGTCPTQFFVTVENARIGDDGMLHYGIRIRHTAPGTLGDVLVNPHIGTHFQNIPPEGAYLDTDYRGASSFLPVLPAGTDPDSIVTVLDIRSQNDYEADQGCQRFLTFVKSSGPTPTPKPICGLPEARAVNTCQEEARKDSNPNDTLCCKPIAIGLSATEHFLNVNYNPYSREIETESVQRKIGVVLVHPYLDQIWANLNSETQGLFNVFRPKDQPNFTDESAASIINYSFVRTNTPPGGGAGRITGTPGNFYFPLLGGIQSAKEWISQVPFLPRDR